MKQIKSLFIAALLAFATGCTQIDTGNLGIESTMGQVKAETLSPGVYFTLFKKVVEVTGREVPMELNNLTPKTKDNITLADLDVTVYYQLDPAQAAKTATKYVGDLIEVPGVNDGSVALGFNLVGRTAREAAYRAAAKWNSIEVHTKRTELASDMRESLQAELDADAGKGRFSITNVIVRSITTDPRLEAAIKDAAQVEFQVRAKQQQSQLAQAESDRRRIEAEGEARANRIISDSLTDKLIEIRKIEAFEKLASKQGNTTMIVPANATPLFNLK